MSPNTRFETNDDYAHLLITQGHWTGSPSNETLSISRVIGELLRTLYNVAPFIPWYPLLQVVTLSFALYGILRLAEWAFSDRAQFIGLRVSSLVGLQFLDSYFRLQFTKVSIVGSGVGAILVLFDDRRSQQVLGCLLVFVSVSWRFGTGSFVVVLVCLYFVAVRLTSVKRHILRLASVLAMTALALILSVLLWNSWAPWLTEAQRTYTAFNGVRGQLDGSGDFVGSPKADRVAEQAGFSSTDWDLFKAWYFADPEVFSTARLKEVAAEKPVLRSDLETWSAGFSKTLKLIFPSCGILFLTAAGVIGVLKRNRLVVALRCLLMFTLWTLSLWIVFVWSRAPNRLVEPLFLIALVLCLAEGTSVARSSHQELGGETDQLTAEVHANSVLFALILLVGSYQGVLQTSAFLLPRPQSNLDVVVNSVRALSVDRPIVAFPEFSSPMVDVQPFRDPRTVLPNWSLMVPLGTTVRSPDYFRRLETLSLGPNLLCEFSEGRALIGTGNPNILELVDRFTREHCRYPAKISDEPIAQIGWLQVWASEQKRER